MEIIDTQVHVGRFLNGNYKDYPELPLRQIEAVIPDAAQRQAIVNGNAKRLIATAKHSKEQ